MSVKSVYNFVPAPKESEVFKPEWADQVNHDIPFSDAESGEIDITISAETPIFIRNGYPKGREENEFSNYFINGEKKYFIPATSLKGMFRNVLEIITSSRMILTDSISEKNPVTFGMRDMNNPEYTADNAKVKSGWLMKRENDLIIQSCDNHRIALKDVEKEFRLPSNSLKCSGIEKNSLCTEKIKNKLFSFSEIGDLGKWVGNQYDFDKNGDFEGYIVLYGDIDNKRYDYIFSAPNGADYSVDPELVEKLDNIEKNSENADDSLWLYFNKENWQPGIPVFFIPDKDGKTVKHFGLTKLYRRNNSHYLNKLEPFKGYLNSKEKDKFDLAELLFGSVRTEALKGRVFISHAWAKETKVGEPTERILNSPKPSFYPAYLNQSGNEGELKGAYKTYHDKDAELRGFKRYPVHDHIKPNIESDNENIASQFIPLVSGTFKGKIRYFNLRPFELGALISAITFHGNSEKLFHSIGGAKPYGFGKVKILIKGQENFDEHLKEFEYLINKHLIKIKKRDFSLSKNMLELLSMASLPTNGEVDGLLQYPAIEKKVTIKGKEQKINEFNYYKKEEDWNKNPKKKEYLESYSERNGAPIIKRLAEDNFVPKSETQKKEREDLRLKLIEEREENERIEFLKFISQKNVDELIEISKETKQDFKRKLINDRIESLINEKVDFLEESKDTDVLSEFIRRFPTHPSSMLFKKRIEEIYIGRKKVEAEGMMAQEINCSANNFQEFNSCLKETFIQKNKKFEFSDGQKEQIKRKIKECWRNDPEAFVNKMTMRPFKKFPWQNGIKDWIGPEEALKLFNEFKNQL